MSAVAVLCGVIQVTTALQLSEIALQSPRHFPVLNSEPAPLRVVSPSGTAIGHYATTPHGEDVRQFFGLPYAHPISGTCPCTIEL